MVQLVKYFNENYGQQYDNIDYPRTSKEMYQTYQVIKSYGIKDDKLLELLNAIVLPKPKTNKEKEMFSECLYEVSDNGSLLNDLIYKRTPFLKLTKDDLEVIEVERDEGKQNILLYIHPHKIDFLNELEDVQYLGYNLIVKTNEPDYGIVETNYNEITDKIYWNDLNQPIQLSEGAILLYNGIKPNSDFNGMIIGDYLTIQVNERIDFELKLFKIDTLPTLPSHDDLAYYLAIGKDGKLYKYSENR